MREARLRFGNPAVVKERVDAEDAALGLRALFAMCAMRCADL